MAQFIHDYEPASVMIGARSAHLTHREQRKFKPSNMPEMVNWISISHDPLRLNVLEVSNPGDKYHAKGSFSTPIMNYYADQQTISRPQETDNPYAPNYKCECVRGNCGGESVVQGRMGDVHDYVSWNDLIQSYMPYRDGSHTGWSCTVARNVHGAT
jgi:hypothetical protein